ncbi:hypothetical protein N8697_01380 [bacterium]|nr:hypothetical protein [bacterium]
MKQITIQTATQMKIATRNILAWGVLIGTMLLPLGQALGQTLPLEIRQDYTHYNYQSAAGVPLSSTTGNPAGSDGRAPTSSAQQSLSLTINPPTANQFGSLISWGAVAAPDNVTGLTSGISYSGNAANIGLPHGGTGSSQVVLQRAQVGAPYLNRPVSFLFGGIISPPDEDENGTKLVDTLPGSYWLAEPHLLDSEKAGGHEVKGYYYSPHARAVFAIQPGPIEIIWRRATPESSQPSDSNVSTKWHESVGNYFRIYNKRYVVSGSAAKTPKKIYWNQAGYPGPQVSIPTTTIGALHIVYNTNVPKDVDVGIPAISLGVSSSGDNDDVPVYKTTLSYENGNLKALNAEGRVFVELLGDLREDGTTRSHLGYEIVDVFKHSTPASVTTELGDPVGPTEAPVSEADALLHPVPLLQIGSKEFTHTTGGFGGSKVRYYAVRETENLNDYQIHWMEEGLEGILWPARHVRYKFVWPDDPARYSHYVRPTVTADRTAASTAVKLPLDNVPYIQYQDSLDRPRAHLSSTYDFYTELNANYPEHRTLLRFNSGDNVYFERIFSWLESGLKDASIGQSDLGTKFWVPARDLKIWGTSSASLTENRYDSTATDPVTTLKTGFLSSDQLQAPRYITQTVDVGMRIEAPTGELGSGGSNYWAGYILIEAGDSYDPDSYIDPIANGFEAANLGSIIPVNADPANNILEVYWYRKNGADAKKGFKPTYWPAALARYTLQWPTAPKEIVLASNDGSGALSSLEAKGSIYTQNNSNEIGYNPNEEHALMLAGQAYALRDDLNITSGTSYSSHPHVLLSYKGSDDRPSMSVFKVLREKPSEGIVFDYITEAGQMLQAPMPLPLLAKPVSGTGSSRVNHNTEPPYAGVISVLESSITTAGSGYTSADGLTTTVVRPVLTITESGGTATVTTSAAHSFVDSEMVNIIGATGSNASNYNSAFQITKISSTSFTFSVASGTGDAAGSLFASPTASGSGAKVNITAAPITTDSNGNFASGGNITGCTIYTGGTDYVVGDVLLIAGGTAGSVTVQAVEVTTGADPLNGWVSATAAQKAEYGLYQQFTYEDRKGNHWVYRGLHAGPPVLVTGTYANGSFDAQDAAATATAKVGEAFSYTVHTSRRAATLTMAASSSTPRPTWLSINGLTLTGTPQGADEGSESINLVVTPSDGSATVTKTLVITVSSDSGVAAAGQAPMDLSYNANGVMQELGNRPPDLAAAPTSANSFRMRFYYKTLPGFAWPGSTAAPPENSIVPYLRPVGSTTDGGASSTPSLDIVYRPVWPADTPVLNLSETLTNAKKELPAVRGQSSLKVLYQQSIAHAVASGEDAASVTLHDPTREKSSALVKVPSSVKTSPYLGKTFFPNLPPHLSQRLFYDPNRGSDGELVFGGKFVDEAVGEKYLLLNVLSTEEVTALKLLCAVTDPDYSAWANAIDALTTKVETFYEPVAYEEATGFGPGQWVANTGSSSVIGFSGDTADGAKPFGIRDLAKITHDDSAVDSYALSANGPGVGYVTLINNDGNDPTNSGLPVSVHIIRVGKPMYRGEIKVLYSSNALDEKVTFQHTADLAAKFSEFDYEWMIQPPIDGAPPKLYYAANDTDYDPANPTALAAGWTLLDNGSGPAIHCYTLGGSGIQTLSDNYIIMRYKPNSTNTTHPLVGEWSEWSEPQLAEGWIKRVLRGINPFNQRTTDMFSNSVNTQGSMLTQAGKRWEGDIALNLENIDDHGLLEIYETVLNRGKMLSIEAGIDYGPANDALLLAAGYINDLYMMVGNDAWADAANPTIGIGTKDRTYGDIATALFAFKGQMPSLLEEELALLRGRDDFMQPGVETGPVYNRMFWNYTRGIDSGEVIYALNYNIQEDQGKKLDGSIDAQDAARMYPQGHGDAYGHYLSAIKGYYKLITDVDFTWAPRTEAVTVLGKPVQVDYMDERKFAAAASALARAGNQIFDLTWRRDYEPGEGSGWANFEEKKSNERRSHTEGDSTVNSTRRWGMDHWASRNGIGTMVNWVVGNAMLPAVDTDPSHEGIQKIDRTTVPELNELTTFATDLQTSMDNAEGHLTPLGLPEDALAFDVNPNSMVGTSIETHYEQIAGRANKALANAVSSFDDAKDVTRLMRSEEDSLTDLTAAVSEQELAYEHRLIELYGTPYTDDIGPGKTYKKDYTGPDLINYTYLETPEKVSDVIEVDNTITIEIVDVPVEWTNFNKYDAKNKKFQWPEDGIEWKDLTFLAKPAITINLDGHGFPKKPGDWKGKRASPGELQRAMSEVVQAYAELQLAADDTKGAFEGLDDAKNLLAANQLTNKEIKDKNRDLLIAEQVLESVTAVTEITLEMTDGIKEAADLSAEAMAAALPKVLIMGMSNGGHFTSAAESALEAANGGVNVALNTTKVIGLSALKALDSAISTTRRWTEFDYIEGREKIMGQRDEVDGISSAIGDAQGKLWTLNAHLRKLEDARERYRALVAKGDRILLERTNFRKRSAAIVQGFRTRDAAFRIFRNEKLERYKTLYDLAAQYTYLAAKSYDYETGLLHTEKGRGFVKRIVNSRALGVVKDGQPQYAASNTGDPGLSSILAEMQADWDVLKGRLGFNNPDTYGTTVSMRGEKYRILPGANGSDSWRDVLENARTKDIRQDADVSRYCMQVDSGDGLPVPGLVIEFNTIISDGLNLFGKPLAPADSYFSPSSFANKIHAVGIAFNGYQGIAEPNSNSGTVGGAGGDSPGSPGGGFLDPNGLSATPYVYLVPVGVDSMRSPPLGDASGVRSWVVQDVAVPMPFNIGGLRFEQ